MKTDDLPTSVVWLNYESENLLFVTAGIVIEGDTKGSTYRKQPEFLYMDRMSPQASSSNQDGISQLSQFPTNSWIKVLDKELLFSQLSNPQDVIKDSDPPKDIPPIVHNDVQPLIAMPGPRKNPGREVKFVERGTVFPSKSSGELAFDFEGLVIPRSDLVLKGTIGSGTFFLLLQKQCYVQVPYYDIIFWR